MMPCKRIALAKVKCEHKPTCIYKCQTTSIAKSMHWRFDLIMKLKSPVNTYSVRTMYIHVV